MPQGTSQPAPSGSHGFDCASKLTAASARKMRDAGFLFAGRYLSLSNKPPQGDLTPAEVDAILGADLALMPVQHVAQEGWVPTQQKGTTNGTNAVSHANAVGIPPGVNVWLDLEGVRHDVADEDIIDYCNAWSDVVTAAGYPPGIYVGANCGLSGDQLFWRLKFKYYWKSGSTVPDIPERGYCMVQRIVPSDKVAGIEIDRDLTKVDAMGNAPVWLKA